MAYISIYGNVDYDNTPLNINKDLWFDGIQLNFDDCDNTGTGELKIISYEQVCVIVDFTKKIDLSVFSIDIIVHCFAGISRSAGVAKFINDCFDLKLPRYEGLYVFNRDVYNQLRKRYAKF